LTIEEMNMRTIDSLLALVILCVNLPCATDGSQIAPAYLATPILVPRANYVSAEAISTNGRIAVGAYDSTDKPMAGRFVGSDFEAVTSLTPGGAYARSINDSGAMVGWSVNDAGLSQPVAWVGDSPILLGSLGGDRGDARSINESGQIVGRSRNADALARAFLKSGNAAMTELPMTLGGLRSYATAISNSGFVAGHGSTPDNLTIAVRYDLNTSTLITLGTLGGNNSFSNGINDLGHVVGLSDTTDGFRPFFWSQGTGMIDIFASSDLGSPFGSAFDVNNQGIVVGYGEINANFDSRAFAWSNIEGLVNLNDRIDSSLGIVLFGASGINENGMIVGWGQYQGMPAGFVLTPVPEPASIVGFGSGIVLIAMFRRHRSRRDSKREARS
jgi:probable HAF family extracellular repeat protein